MLSSAWAFARTMHKASTGNSNSIFGREKSLFMRLLTFPEIWTALRNTQAGRSKFNRNRATISCFFRCRAFDSEVGAVYSGPYRGIMEESWYDPETGNRERRRNGPDRPGAFAWTFS